MVNVQLEKIFFHYLFSERRELLQTISYKFFESKELQRLYGIFKEFYEKYSEIPSRYQTQELVKLKNLSEELDSNKLKAIFDISLSEYDNEWLKESFEAWVEFKNLDLSVIDLVTYLKTIKISNENIHEVVAKAKSMITERNNLVFEFDSGLDFFNPEHHQQKTNLTFSTGYDYLDTVLGGGWSSKSLYVIAGQQKIGKSIWLTNFAANGVKLGYNTAYISLEMRDHSIVKRLGANLLGIDIKEYSTIGNNTLEIKNKLKNLNYSLLQIPGKLLVKEFPTSSASTLDIENWLKKVEELQGFKFKLVIIDYVNILKNWRNPNTENTYMKIKQIAEDLRAMGMRNDWCILTATQINRSGYNSTDISDTNIAESSGLGHTVDAMFGIIQDEFMYASKEYLLKLLANRHEGYKNSKKKFLINYNYMQITEDLNSSIILE